MFKAAITGQSPVTRSGCGCRASNEELLLDVEHLTQFDEILDDTADRFDHLKRFRRKEKGEEEQTVEPSRGARGARGVPGAVAGGRGSGPAVDDGEGR